MGILKNTKALPQVDAKQSTAKVKTKAKQRYLKRKKERKKIKSKAPASKAKTTNQPLDDDVQSDGTDEDEHDLANDEDVEMLSVQAVSETPKPATERKPKKRPKLDENSATDIAGDDPIDNEPATADTEDPNPIPKKRSPTPVVALPSFPLPVLPNAPSKSLLAKQGLDQALLGAEIVDPDSTLAIPPDGEEDGGTCLGEKTRKRLKELGIEELFAVQTCILPFLLQEPSHRALYLPYAPPRDVCVSAPTGSGKTLAYVLPIVEMLSTRIVTRLRALIVLPTRDLVIQVRETFEATSKGRGLKIATATGQHSFAHEQAQLVADKTPTLKGGSSKVDILICTPGRLIDHLNGTPNFTLQHLRFLVIDEADRLLAQSFQDWLNQVLTATRPPAQTASSVHQNSIVQDTPTAISTVFPDSVAPAFLSTLPLPDIPGFFTEQKATSCQKLLFSATLTSDPGKLASLGLREPKYFVVKGNKKVGEGKGEGGDDGDAMVDVVMEKYTMPTSLSEHYIVCPSSQKPLVLFHLVRSQQVTNALVFTKSAESTTRLVRLFNFLEEADKSKTPMVICAYSSDLPASERRAILEKFKAQEIQMYRPVSYDAPVDMRKYVHRVGRTARAGRSGDAWTLVEEQEARYFKGMMKTADHLDKVRRVKISSKDMDTYTKHYETALEKLKKAYM
ncbi:hypothetical protein ONZ45_g17762 [Pleurotus djamor]|nr:hypothetical protein ONZ45_g17762 [Pleurotus djamor]